MDEDQITADPYPQYQQVRAEVARQAGQFSSPDQGRAVREVIARRGRRWCTSVLAGERLGRPGPFTGLGSVNHQQVLMLLIADQMNLDPPYPPALLAREQAGAAAAVHRDEQDRWEQALAGCSVQVSVRENARSSSRSGGRLRHVVPDVDAVSDLRRHPVGIALCELPDRWRPLQLRAPVQAPATCTRCLAATSTLRVAADR